MIAFCSSFFLSLALTASVSCFSITEPWCFIQSLQKSSLLRSVYMYIGLISSLNSLSVMLAPIRLSNSCFSIIV